jgi:hypothetical protein
MSMAKTAALGDGPIMFFNQGAHIEVPLSALFFENDQIDTTRTDLRAVPAFVAWITFLSQQKRIVAAAAPPVASAVILEAADPGSAGNNIQLTVTRKTATTVDLTATETDIYPGLTMATLKARLGADGVAALGTEPGLLHVKAFPAGSETQTVVATTTASIAPTGTSTAPKWPIAGTGTSAVTLEPRNGGAAFNEADAIAVVISNVSADGLTFTLTVSWTLTVPNVSLAGGGGTTSLAAAFGALGFLVDARAPDGGFKMPRPGTVRLSGGAEQRAPVLAGTTLLAND